MARGFSHQIVIEGMPGARRIAQRIRNLGENPRELWEIAGSVLEASTARRFDRGQGPGGVPWPPTQRQRKGAVGPHGPNKRRILVDTGDLRDSLRHETRSNEVEIGFDDFNKPPGVVAALHFGSHRQTVVMSHVRTITVAFGVPIPPREVRVRAHGRMTNLPARPMVGVDADDKRDVEEAWLIHLRSLLRA